MSDNLHILLVEDCHDISENIVLYLENKGHIVDAIYTGVGGLSLAEVNTYDVLLLDVMLPKMDGLTLAKKIRNNLHIHTPILFITARDTLDDKLEGFASGGDDYLTKPFALEELEARINALAKRSNGQIYEIFEVEPWRIDARHFQAYFQGVPFKTTKTGFKILKMLLSQYPQIVIRRNIEKLLWGEDPPDSDALRSHMYHLRKELSVVFKHPVIETVHGIGFRFHPKGTEVKKAEVEV